jgi:nickel-dependent lactate racemase
MPMRLEGNPVAEHLQSLLTLIDSTRIFAIQVVVDARDRIAGVFAGDLDRAFSRAVELAGSVFSRDFDRPYDAVLCEMLPPLDENLYQAQKALENCRTAVVDGGSLIVVSACARGIGSTFFFDQAAGWNRETNQPHDGVYRFGSHKLSRVNALSKRIDVGLHSTLTDEVVSRVFYQPVKDIQGYINERAGRTNEYRVAVVHDAGHTVLKRQTTSQ